MVELSEENGQLKARMVSRGDSPDAPKWISPTEKSSCLAQGREVAKDDRS